MLDAKLRKLRLGHAASVLEAHHQGAINAKLGYLEFLERLVDDELSTRENKGLDKRLRAARFPVLKTLEEFDFNFDRTKVGFAPSSSRARASSPSPPGGTDARDGGVFASVTPARARAAV